MNQIDNNIAIEFIKLLTLIRRFLHKIGRMLFAEFLSRLLPKLNWGLASLWRGFYSERGRPKFWLVIDEILSRDWSRFFSTGEKEAWLRYKQSCPTASAAYNFIYLDCRKWSECGLLQALQVIQEKVWWQWPIDFWPTSPYIENIFPAILIFIYI